jgi:hypothetical protein
MTIANPFDVPLLQIEQATANIERTKTLIADAADNTGGSFVERFDEKRDEKVVLLKLPTELPAQLRYTATLVIRDLREALDQVTCKAFDVCAPQQNAKSIYFPFGSSEQDFNGKLKGELKGKGLPEIVIQAFAASQCYRGGDDELWSLNGLSNVKHRDWVRLDLNDQDAHIQMGFGEIVGPAVLGVNKWNRDRTEIELMRVGKGGKIELPQLKVGLQVTIGNGEVVKGRHLLPTLEAYRDKVKATVLAVRQAVVKWSEPD